MQPTTTPRRRRRQQPKDVVRQLRTAAGLSQYELAKRAGLSRSLLCEVESGKRAVTLRTARLLAPILGVKWDEIPTAAAA